MLHKIKEVFKIVNLEGEFSEIYHEKNYAYFDISPLRKSAIVHARAKVLVGINLDSTKIKLDESTRTIKITISSTPKIISNELTLDYFDLQQGSFNQFTPEEINLMQDKIRDLILRKAESSELMTKATQRTYELMTTLQQYCELLNWKLVFINEQSGEVIQYKN